MRKLVVRSKSKVAIDIPDSLLNFLKFVDVLIKDNDEVTTMPSDDCIQNEDACGGLDDNLKTFSFTYFPDDTYKWTIRFTASEIEEIASGTITQINLWSCNQGNCQNMFVDQDDTCFEHDYEDDEDEFRRKTREFFGLED